ncbi:MAG TPA: serine hydrolase [Thermoanaerobaculia bacterium]
MLIKSLVAAIALLLSGAAERTPADAVGRLGEIIPKAMREAEVPGVSVALIRDGRVAWSRAFGVKNVETRAAMDEKTVFESASLSKPVFAYAVMKLVDAGKLALDVPLVKYMPVPAVLGDERAGRITARMVLDHTTGFQNEAIGKPLAIHFTPGTRFSYSGAGYAYLQTIVERVTGEPLEAFMKKAVFGPLGMTSSSFVWQDGYASRRATGYKMDGTAGRDRRPSEGKASSSLFTTAPDYARFVLAAMNGTGLTKESARRMLETQVRVEESCFLCVDRKASKLSPALSWGLGWGLERTEDGPAFWQWGDYNGEVQSFAIGIPRTKSGIVVLTNSGSGLSIVPAIVTAALRGDHPVFAWLPYEPYDSPGLLFYREILERGGPAIRRYRETRKTGNGVRLTETQMNDLGYRLLAKEKNEGALEIFKINAEDFPSSSNVHDSLGQGYLAVGDVDAAIKSYRKSLELDPSNENARNVLKQLKAE